jgi:hypothetical protein
VVNNLAAATGGEDKCVGDKVTDKVAFKRIKLPGLVGAAVHRRLGASNVHVIHELHEGRNH